MHKQTALLFSLLLLSTQSLAQDIDQTINKFLAPVANTVDAFFMTSIPIPFVGDAPFIVIWLVVAATFFTLSLVFLLISGLSFKAFEHVLAETFNILASSFKVILFFILFFCVVSFRKGVKRFCSLLCSDIPLGTGEHFVTNHEFFHSGRS